MTASAAAEELYEAFDEFQHSVGTLRKERLARMQSLCTSLQHKYGGIRLSEKCTGLLGVCKDMARLRQPAHYDEQHSIQIAHHDLSAIADILNNANSEQDAS